MASIFQEITLEWGGETYKVTPTMRLINQIENDVSLSRLAMRAAQGDTPLSQVAIVFTHLLRAAGCKTTEEEVYQAMFSEDSTEVVMQALSVALNAFYPSTESGNELKKNPKRKAKK